jgi:hypothetical protein
MAKKTAPQKTFLNYINLGDDYERKARFCPSVLSLILLTGPSSETEAIINDAVSQLRPKLWKSPLAERLAMHNRDYGFARNFTGLRLVWLPLSTLSAIACWGVFYFSKANLPWCIAATLLAVLEYRRALTQYLCQTCNMWHLSPANRQTPSKKCAFCAGSDGQQKDAYATEQNAKRRAAIIRKESSVSLRAYACQYGNGWHLTKSEHAKDT